MEGKVMFRNVAAGICMAALSGMAHAGDTALDESVLPSAGLYTRDTRAYVLALNEGDAAQGPAGAATVSTTPVVAAQTAKAAPFEPPLLTGSKVHQYLGLSTLASFLLTAATAPEGCEHNCTAQPRQTSGTHQSLGRATAVLAAATVTSGLLSHWDDVHLEDGWADPDNQHALVGTAGAIAMLYAVNKALKATSSGNGHPGMAIAGGIAMGVAVKLTW